MVSRIATATDLQEFTDKAKSLAADIRELKIGAEPNVIDLELIHKEAELRALIQRDYEGAMTSLMNLYQVAL
jgi:hypothetical protein